MGKTLSQLRSLVIENCRREDKTSLIDIAINLALEEIVQIHPWKEFRATYDASVLQGQNTMPIPGNVKDITQVRVLDVGTPDSTSATDTASTTLGYIVPILSEKQVEAQYPNLSVSNRGIPDVCFIQGSQVVFVPPFSDDKLVRILADGYVPELLEDDDENPLPRTDNAVVAWATAYLFRSIEQFENSREWQGEYAKAIKLALHSDNRRPGQRRQMAGAVDQQPRYVDYRENIYTNQR